MADSLVEAAETPNACPWYRAVYADDEVAGFVMISDGIDVRYTEYLGPYFLWRLLVDVRWQGQGVVGPTLDLVVDHVRGPARGGDVVHLGRARARSPRRAAST